MNLHFSKATLHRLCYFAILIFFSACNLDNRVGNSKALVEEMNNRKIKRVTGSQMATIIDDWGKRIVKKSQQVLDQALTEQPKKSVEYCALRNLSEIDSLRKMYGVDIKLLTTNDLKNKNLSQKEQEVLEAYLYNAKNNLPPTSNIQKLGDSIMIYNVPAPIGSSSCKACMAESNLVLWSIRFIKQDVIKRVDEKSLLKMKSK